MYFDATVTVEFARETNEETKRKAREALSVNGLFGFVSRQWPSGPAPPALPGKEPRKVRDLPNGTFRGRVFGQTRAGALQRAKAIAREALPPGASFYALVAEGSLEEATFQGHPTTREEKEKVARTPRRVAQG